MLPPVQIPLGVFTQDCLAWSRDGELAVAAGEEIYLLLPRFGHGEPWTHLRIRVNNFTYEEWPMPGQASFADMSIGQEQGKVSVISLAWSSVGLGKYRHPVLAVLTSNLLLSIWAPDSDVTNPSDWKRVFIFNNIAVPTDDAADTSGVSLQRVRCMAWAPACPQHTESQTAYSKRKPEPRIIALADDNNSVYFLTVSSPFNHPSGLWDAQVLTHRRLPRVYNNTHRPSLLQVALNAKQIIDSIRFCNWSFDNQVSVSCGSSGMYHRLMLSLSLDTTISANVEELNGPVSHDEYADLKSKAPALFESSIETQQIDYGQKHRLDVKDVTFRTWGLACFEGIVALCATFHPTKMIEYRGLVEGSATVLFRAEAAEDISQADEFPWQLDPVIDESKARQAILATVQSPPSPYLAEIISGSQHTLLTPFDRKILNAVTQINAPLQTYGTSQGPNGASEAHLEDTNPDICPFCGETVGMPAPGAFREARCANGHAFARCVLTCLPILQPGCSKYCSRCKREFLNEECLSDLAPDNDADRHPDEPQHPTLARILFSTFDTCPYCSGRYCG